VLLRLVNGVRTIDLVIEESGLDRYTATRTLYACARKEWITPVHRPGEREYEQDVEVAFDARKALRWGIPVALLLAAALILSMDGGRFAGEDPFVGEWLSRSARLQDANRVRGLRTAVEVYRVKNGRYPEALDALVTEGLVTEDALETPSGARWKYAATDDGEAYALGPEPAPAPQTQPSP
jgi:hypothetical protein